MGRLIFIVLIVVLVVWLLRRAIEGPRPRGGGPAPDGGEAKGDLVSCAHCGVNLPKGEAYAARGVLPGAGGRYFCSEEHWRLGPRDG
jgi:uncharacterized protein